MAYLIPDIIQWAKISAPLARYNQAKKRATTGGSIERDLDVELYVTRRDVQYAYDQNADSDIQFTTGNYLLALCGIYLFQAQTITGGGGSITPVTPSVAPDPYDFDVDASTSFILAGATTKTLPSAWVGFNILFVRGHITQSKVDNTVDTCYAWDKANAILTLINGAAQLGENFQIFPII